MMRKRKYEDECRMALEIASGDAGYQACNVAIAQAILGSPEHGIVLSQDGRGNHRAPAEEPGPDLPPS